MSEAPNTLFLRLEGALQAWGDNSKIVIRRTMDAPTKSGVIGLICCAMGIRREAASQHPIPEAYGELREMADRLVPEGEDEAKQPRRTILGVLGTLAMGVRIDRLGIRWWDYHTVGAKIGLLRADGKGIKRTGGGKNDPIETLVSRREYLCDASFLVALHGDPELIQLVVRALRDPKWSLFLGRKACPPSVPVLVTRERSDSTHEADVDRFDGVKSALTSRHWTPRCESDVPRDEKHRRLTTIPLDCLIEWRALSEQLIAPADAEVWYDAPVSFDPPVHEARLVVREPITAEVGGPLQQQNPRPSRQRADYKNEEYKKRRKLRLDSDHRLCVFCKSPATTVQHITYRRAGGGESQEDLRSLCRLCHDAVTMIEYGLGMGLDRINPEEPQWRDQIVRKRQEIIEFRSLETRRRRLQPEEVE